LPANSAEAAVSVKTFNATCGPLPAITMASPRMEDVNKNKKLESKMTATENLEVGLFMGFVIVALPAAFVLAHWLGA
jgi:hypothetical protein